MQANRDDGNTWRFSVTWRGLSLSRADASSHPCETLSHIRAPEAPRVRTRAFVVGVRDLQSIQLVVQRAILIDVRIVNSTIDVQRRHSSTASPQRLGDSRRVRGAPALEILTPEELIARPE